MLTQKATHHAKKHKYKIILGTPIIFALFVNVNNIEPTANSLSLISEASPYVEVGDRVSFDVVAKTQGEVNAAGGRIVFGSVFSIHSLSTENSVLDLWAQYPSIADGEITFSGGITNDTHLQGEGTLLTFEALALAPGTQQISLLEPELLANDGMGTNVLTKKNDGVLYVREKGLPSPDVNNDGHVSLMDINIVYFNSLRAYNSTYDLNGDGDVTLSDVKVLLSLI